MVALAGTHHELEHAEITTGLYSCYIVQLLAANACKLSGPPVLNKVRDDTLHLRTCRLLWVPPVAVIGLLQLPPANFQQVPNKSVTGERAVANPGVGAKLFLTAKIVHTI